MVGVVQVYSSGGPLTLELKDWPKDTENIISDC